MICLKANHSLSSTLHSNNTESMMNFESHGSSTLLSGALGLVIVPDHATIERAYALAEEIMPKDAEYVLRRGSLPHLTLYHGKLADVPGLSVSETLKELRTELVGQKFTLKEIVAFGGNFIFWNVDRSSPACEVLQASHATALNLAQYLDRSTVAKAVSEEGLSLKEAELENVRRFGHPLVRSLYMPHITIGFHHGLSALMASDIEVPWAMEVASVELVKVGHPGRVKEIIDLTRAV
jgi:2'-5' RNA ligase